MNIAQGIVCHPGEALAGIDGAIRSHGQVVAQAVTEGANAPLSSRHALAHRIERTDAYLAQVGQGAIQHGYQEFAVRFRGEAPVAGLGGAEGRQSGVYGEVQPLSNEEIENVLSKGRRLSRERTDKGKAAVELALRP